METAFLVGLRCSEHDRLLTFFLAGERSHTDGSRSAVALQGDILPLVHKVCDGSFLEVVAAMMSDEFRCDF